MIVKFITETETLLDVNVTQDSLTKELEDEIMQFNDREIISATFEFNPGVKVIEMSDFCDIEPNQIKKITSLIK